MKITWFPDLADLPQFIIELSFIIGFFILLIGSVLLFGLLCGFATHLYQIIYIRLRAPELIEISRILYALGAARKPKQQVSTLSLKLKVNSDLYNDMPYYMQVSEILQNHTELNGDTYKDQLQAMKDMFPNYKKLLRNRELKRRKEICEKLSFWMFLVITFFILLVIIFFVLDITKN